MTVMVNDDTLREKERIRTKLLPDGTWVVLYRDKIAGGFSSELEAIRTAGHDLLGQVGFAYFLAERAEASEARMSKIIDHAWRQLKLQSREELEAMALKRG